MLSDKSISCIACEVEECAFSTPKLGRDAYPAMVAHLQVHSVVKHGIQIGQAINPLCSCGDDQDLAVRDSPLDDGAQQNRAAVTRRARTLSQPAMSPGKKSVGRRGRSLSRSRGLEYPCTDCNKVSFETEEGLFNHRRRSCGLKGVKLTSTDFACPTCPRAFTSPMGVTTHRRFCKGGEIQNSPRVVTENYSTVGETSLLRARADISKMREEASPQDRRRPGAEKAKKRHQADVIFVEEGPKVVVAKKSVRVTTADEGEERESGGQGRGETESESDIGGKSRTLLGRGFDEDVLAKGTLSNRSQREERSRTEATTSLGHREAWLVDRSSSARSALPQTKVSMEISMKLPTGLRANVVYRVGANTEMKKVVDKVAIKLGVPSSRVQLYIAGTPSPLVRRVVNGSEVDKGVGDISPSRSCWAEVGTSTLANRFHGKKLRAIVV